MYIYMYIDRWIGISAHTCIVVPSHKARVFSIWSYLEPLGPALPHPASLTEPTARGGSRFQPAKQ